MVAWAGELGVEVVLTTDATTVYVDDHGAPFDAKGAKITVTALQADGETTQVELKPTSGNVLTGAPLKARSGTRLSVVLHLADGQVGMARVQVK